MLMLSPFPSATAAASALAPSASEIVIQLEPAPSNSGTYLATSDSTANLGMIGWTNGPSLSPGPVVTFQQGPIEESPSPIDLAVQGDGFFMIEGSQGETLYTRNGSFTLNSQRELVTIQGAPLLGFGIDEHFQIQRTSLVPIEIPLGWPRPAVAQSTENVYLEGALSLSAVTDFLVYDTLGISVRVLLTVIVEQRDNDSTTWKWSANLPDNAPVAGADAAVGTGRVTFDREGSLIDVSDATISIQRHDVASASPLEFELDFSNVSGAAVDRSYISVSRQDGAAPGRLTEFEIGEDGVIRGVFSNGVVRDLGQIQLAHFGPSPKLQQVDAGMFVPCSDTGVRSVGSPSLPGVGIIIAGAIERPATEPRVSYEPPSGWVGGYNDPVGWYFPWHMGTEVGAQGKISDSPNPSDLAIQGSGYFILQGENNRHVYTRNGQFRLNSQNKLASEDEHLLLGFAVDEEFQLQRMEIVPLEIPLGEISAAEETSVVYLEGTLSPTVDVGEGASMEFNVYDNQGTPVQFLLTAVLEERDRYRATYRWSVDLPDNDPPTGAEIAVGTGRLTLHREGHLWPSDHPMVTVSRPGDSSLEFLLDFSDVSGLAAEQSSLALSRQDGSAPGVLTSFAVEDGGIMEGVFSNGVTRQLGQIQLAHFGFSPLLEEVAEDIFMARADSGQPFVGNPGKLLGRISGEGGLGYIVSGAIEQLDPDSYTPGMLTIQGDGFFIVETAAGEQLYTRDGLFYTVDHGSGSERVTQSGARLLGFDVDAEFNLQTSDLVPIHTALGSPDIARATSNVFFEGTLSPTGDLATQAQRIQTGILGDNTYTAPPSSGDLSWLPRETGAAFSGNVIIGDYAYYLTYVAADGTESRPGPLSGPINVTNGRVTLDNLPQADIVATQWRTRRIYRSLATDTSTFHRIGEIPNMDAGQVFVDNLTDAAISTNPTIDLDGPKIGYSTRLVDVLSRDGSVYSQVFEAGTLQFTGEKGGRSLDEKEFDITADTTVQELIDFMDASMGIQSAASDPVFPIPGDMGTGSNIPAGGMVSSDGRIILTGNNGVDNAIDIGLSGMLLDTGTSTENLNLPWGVLQEGLGESAVTDFLVLDTLGIPIRVRLTAVMEARDSASTTYRWFTDSPDNDPTTGTDIAVGTGRITFDGEGNLTAVSEATVSIDRQNVASASPLEFELDFFNISGLATERSSIAVSRQDGAQAGTLHYSLIRPDGRIYGVFSNGVKRDLGQIQLAWFADPTGLEPREDGLFAATADSGPPLIGNPGEEPSTTLTFADKNLLEPLGPIAFLELTGLNPSSGDLSYRLKTTHQGILTLEGESEELIDSVKFALYDQDGNELATSDIVSGNPRIDWDVQAGQTYVLAVAGSATDLTLRLCNLVNHQDTTVTVHGTDTDDTFKFDASASRAVTINDVRYEFDDAEVESATFDGGDGHDVVILDDSAGDDTLTAEPGHALFSSSDTTTGFSVKAEAFEELHAYARSGGHDTAKLYDSNGNDGLKASPACAKLSGDSFYHRVKLFDVVHTYATAGGNDYAQLFDSPGSDRLKATPTYAKLSGETFYNRVKFFDAVIARATIGYDRAYLRGSPDDDFFHGASCKSTFTGPGFNFVFRRFDEVHAHAQEGGQDVAELTDTPGDDHLQSKHLTGGESWAALSQNNGALALLYEAFAFDLITGYRTTGTDTVEKSPEVDFLMLDDGWLE